MVRERDDKAQRPLYSSPSSTEVDNILIDEARTPLIISGNAEEASGTYVRFARAVKGLEEERDFQIDHKSKASPSPKRASLGSSATGHRERLWRRPAPRPPPRGFARCVFLERVDRDYVVKDGEIIIVDEFTAASTGRRWSHGFTRLAKP
ncbi:MAG: hypothetical protein IPH65_17615 [Dehalococcoidia bacterium]|nr:hypothetical protein [Dehalococcoidia bacterium]